jgi:GNAT superfamily N-acetyltransferase
MEIKKATPYDLVDVLFLLKQCIADMNRNGLKQWNSANPSSEVIIEDIEKGTLYIYTELGMAKGMINLSEEMPEEYQQVEWKGNNEKVLYVKRFAVHPIWQDTNIGDQLLQFAENYAKEKGFTSIRLDVLDSYPVDDVFMKSRAFEPAGSFHSEFQKKPYDCFEKNL